MPAKGLMTKTFGFYANLFKLVQSYDNLPLSIFYPSMFSEIMPTKTWRIFYFSQIMILLYLFHFNSLARLYYGSYKLKIPFSQGQHLILNPSAVYKT